MNTLKRINSFLLVLCMASVAIVFIGCKGTGVKQSDILIRQKDSTIEIENGLVRGLFQLRSSAVAQSYYVLKDGNWELVTESLVRPEQNGLKVMPLYARGPGFADDSRLMVQEGLSSVRILENTSDKARILFSGRKGDNQIEQIVTLERNKDFFHIEVKATLPVDRPRIEYLLSSFVFMPPGEPDYRFTPTVKRADDNLIGDRKFYAPATIVEKNGLMMALVPDLDLMNDNIIYAKGARPQKHPRVFAVPVDTSKISFPVAMDLSLNSGVTEKPVISFGFIDYWVEQHVYWRHDNANGAQIRSLSDNKLKFGFDLFLNSNVGKYRGYQRISSYLWERYGTRYFHSPKPQVLPLADYAKICYPASFAYEGYDVGQGPIVTNRSGKPELASWQQWDMNGIAVGGLRLSAPQWYQFIYNTAWWNNVCDATGIFYWGGQLKESSLLDKARRIIRFTLSAPQNDGLFPSLYNIDGKTWQLSLWNPPMEGYDPNKVDSYWGGDKGRGVYQTAAASVTAGFLMYYRQYCENDPGILPYVKKYGDFLIKHTDPNGCVPAWFSKTLEPLPSLRWNADGGAHMWVLSELYRVTKDKKYLDAAEKIAAFMQKEVMPHQKWYDFETFYSCAVKPETFYDKGTGQYPANNMSTSWALEGFASLFEVTRNKEYLAAAEAAADYSIFYQAVWAPHYIVTAYPYGGFSSQNSDDEWLDQRSHRFADGLLRVGLLTGRQDLLERAVAATHASLTLVNLPQSVQNGVYPFPNYPVGLGPENIDHEGFPQMPLRSGPSWCEIGGLAAAAHVLRQLGSVYINFEKNIGLGIDGISVDNYQVKDGKISISLKSLLAELPVPYKGSFTAEMRIQGLPEQNYELVINGGTPVKVTAKDLVDLRLDIEDETVRIIK